MFQIDLHTHTTYSDGTYTPTELIKYAIQKGLKAIAVTDHDTLDGTDEALSAGSDCDIEIIRGIEMSTDYNDYKELHIVGLFIDHKNTELTSALFELRKKRKKRNEQMIEKLNSLGIKICYNELEEISGKKIITRAHFAKIMIRKGYVSSLKECFDKYLSTGKPAYVEREVIQAKETISLINKSGGIAILAHPLLYNISKNQLEQLLIDLKQLGLYGVECIYTTHTKEDTEYLINLANKLDLKISGGSDFHGDNKSGLDLGTGYGELFVPYEILENLKRGVKNE